jgi:hypothetical protein
MADESTAESVREPEGDAPPTATPLTTPPSPNYHISLWDTPPAYLCLLCLDQPPVKRSLADVQSHVVTMHAVTAVPTPLASDPSMILPTFATEAA